MRLPMNDDKVDITGFSKTVDTFIENGFNYFDTAHGYLEGKKRNCDKELPYKPLSEGLLYSDSQSRRVPCVQTLRQTLSVQGKTAGANGEDRRVFFKIIMF